jgi:hypothetical protein
MPTKIQREYDNDFYAWTVHNAELMRAGKLKASMLATAETGIDENAFPAVCPFNLDECLSSTFLSE